MPTPSRLEKLARTGRETSLPPENTAPGLVDAIGRHYPGKPSGPAPKPPPPRFRTKAAAELYEVQQALQAVKPKRQPPAPALRNHDELLAEIRAIYARVWAGKLTGIEARRMVGVLKSMGEVMAMHEIERRVKRITEALERRGVIR